MLGNILGNTPSERRPNAEFVQAVRSRWAEVYEAADLEHSAELHVYPRLFAVPKSVQTPAMPAVDIPKQVASNVINLASQREVRVLNDQERLEAEARLAVEASLENYEAAA